MNNDKWGVWAICKGMMAGLARQAWVKDDNGKRFEGSKQEAEAYAKFLNDSLSGISRINIGYSASPIHSAR